MTNILKKKHSGVAILLLTTTLLLISTLLTLFTTQYSSIQQKISAGLYQNQQAFEAATAGLETAIPYFQSNYSAITTTQSGGFLTPYVNSSTQNVALANGSTYTFVYSNPTANNYQLITITSTGKSADATSTRTVTQQIQAYTSGTPPPTISLTTKGNVSMSNSSSLNNTSTNSNLKAGGSIDFDNSSHTTISSGVGSNSSGIGSDVQQNNASIAAMSTNSFFQSIFGVDQSTVQSKANFTYTNSSNTSYNSLAGVTNSIIWINQTSGTAALSGTLTIGSATQPVILIVNGNLKISNSVTIYGLVFIMNSTQDTILRNTATVNGAMASTNNITFTNNTALNYNSTVLNALPASGSAPSYSKVPNSWRDF